MTPAPSLPSALAQSNTPGTSVPASGAAPVLAQGGSPFDAILMLEELAASLVPVDAAGIDAGAAELGTEMMESPEDRDGEDSVEESAEEGDDLLAFLAGMIAAAPPVAPTRPPSADAAGECGEGATAGSEAKPHAPAQVAELALPADLSDTVDATAPSNGGTNANAVAAPVARPDAEAAARAFANFVAAPEGHRTEEAGPPVRASDFLTHAPRTAQAPSPVQPSVTAHVRDPRWAEEFGARIVTMVNQRESVASISLLPADLGPVDVNVTVKDSQASIQFGAAQADTRALIEASLPKLRELLAAQGFQLMDASVSQGFTRQHRADAPSVPRPADVEEVTPANAAAVRTAGLLDTYA